MQFFCMTVYLVRALLEGYSTQHDTAGTESLYAASLTVTSAERVLTRPCRHVSLEQRVTFDAVIGLIRLIAKVRPMSFGCGCVLRYRGRDQKACSRGNSALCR